MCMCVCICVCVFVRVCICLCAHVCGGCHIPPDLDCFSQITALKLGEKPQRVRLVIYTLGAIREGGRESERERERDRKRVRVSEWERAKEKDREALLSGLVSFSTDRGRTSSLSYQLFLLSSLQIQHKTFLQSNKY